MGEKIYDKNIEKLKDDIVRVEKDKKLKMFSNSHYSNLERITQIEKAVDKMVDTWDSTTLLNFAYDDRVEYYCDTADEEEVEELLRTWGKE